MSKLYSDRAYVEPTPLPASVPHVDELGVTSAPLRSASFFIGAHCKEINEDFMLCKQENADPAHCLKEGRRVTRCAADLINKMRASCLSEFDAHWNCLEKNNHHFYACRAQEKPLNNCVFTKLNLSKTIPGTPEGSAPIHEKKKPIYKAMQK